MASLMKLSSSLNRKIFHSVFLGVGLGSSLLTVSLHTLLKDLYSTPFHLQKQGFDVSVSDELKRMFADSADDLGVAIIKPPTTLFHCIGFDSMHFGSTATNVGALIGIPITYTFNSVKDIDRRTIKIKGKAVDWNSPQGEKLLDCFILSDAAKQFGIAYELALTNSVMLYMHTIVGPVATMCCVYVNNYFCNAFGLPFRPFAIKGVFYMLLALFGVGLYYMLKDISTHFCELQAIQDVSNAGNNYVTGGIEYYNKLLIRNKILRNVLVNGSSDFNSQGDVAVFFRKKHVPITELKKTLEAMQKPYEEIHETI